MAFLSFRYIILKIRKIGGKKINEVLKAIKERRSIRKYKSDMLPKEIIDQVIESGLFAASGKGQQSPIIISVTNKELRNKLSRMNCEIGGWKEGFDPFFNAPVVLVVLAPKDWANKAYDGSLVMGNMMLAAHALNIGSCWINRARQEFETEEGKEILKSLGIEGEYEGIGHCILGYVDGEYPSVPARKANRVYYVD